MTSTSASAPHVTNPPGNLLKNSNLLSFISVEKKTKPTSSEPVLWQKNIETIELDKELDNPESSTNNPDLEEDLEFLSEGTADKTIIGQVTCVDKVVTNSSVTDPHTTSKKTKSINRTERQHNKLSFAALDPAQTKITEFYKICERVQLEIDKDVITETFNRYHQTIGLNPEHVTASPPFLEMLKETAIANSKHRKHGSRFSEPLKLFSLYLFIVGGRLTYELLYSNLSGALPSTTTLNRLLDEGSKIRERSSTISRIKKLFNQKELLQVFISEDQTAIIRRIYYDPKINEMVGFVLPVFEKTGFPITKKFSVCSLADIKNDFDNEEMSKNAQPLHDKSPAFCLVIFGSGNSFNNIDVSNRWRYVQKEFNKSEITIFGFFSDADPRCLKAMRIQSGLLSSTSLENKNSPYGPYLQTSARGVRGFEGTGETANASSTHTSSQSPSAFVLGARHIVLVSLKFTIVDNAFIVHLFLNSSRGEIRPCFLLNPTSLYAFMEFIILKVNGTDISSFSYEDAVNAFLSAREPIVVEVKRRESESACDTASMSKCMSTAVQTDLSGLNRLEETSFEYLSNDIDFEEVTLRKCNGNEKLGLTVCYSSGSDVDTYTEVYIQNIAPNSVAHCDGRLREGDQILQVNGKDVTNKEETECLFAENPKAVTLLVSRCLSQNDKSTEADSPTEFLSSTRGVAYQNTLIEQLVQQQSSFQQSLTRDGPIVPPHLQLNLTNSLIRSQMCMINQEISELDKRMQNIQLVKRDKFKPLQLPSESDSEHIYETIPESSDSVLEPIYSCPYESKEDNIKFQFYVEKSEEGQTPKDEKAKQIKNVQHNTGKSNSNEEHDNSSSAYNTGGSCNSNLLTVELSCGANQKDNCRSTLVLYAPSEDEKVRRVQEANDNCDACEQVTLKPNKNKSVVSKGINSPSTTVATKPELNISDFLSDTMYTNVANLQQTILLQQQLFRKALGKQSNGTICKPTTSFTTPTLSQYQFMNCQQTYKTKDAKMEWKVKRRSDGTRYIARRPVRNRILRNRALRISEERAGATTEDDTISEFKMGKYWKKEDRKKHLEKSKERKQRLENSDGVYQKPFDKVHSSSTKKSYTNADNSNKKHKAKRTNKEEYHDFTTVQEMLMHGPQVLPNSNSKIMGLLSVTTV
ncbi:hypothetical protein RN001_016373 [Aquatica leii]|uniref:PDZ domain-containing protein n=1 Tax=Aquatica leii TaxID=1421715 RepID=A0AAN7SBA2_9COLE|nr:hypothetical protein RN001_016373 [Aquatica leii]